MVLVASNVRIALPGEDGYEAARTIWNAMVDRGPAIVARCSARLAQLGGRAASFYLDNIAERIEREINPLGPRGRPSPLPAWLNVGLRFAALSLLVNLAVLVLTLITGRGSPPSSS